MYPVSSDLVGSRVAAIATPLLVAILIHVLEECKSTRILVQLFGVSTDLVGQFNGLCSAHEIFGVSSAYLCRACRDTLDGAGEMVAGSAHHASRPGEDCAISRHLAIPPIRLGLC